jgi:hypothetical protein
MTDSERHPYVELIAREARKPVVTDRAARERIMTAVRAEPVPRPRTSIWERVVAPRSWTLSPMTGSLLAAGLVGLGVVAGALVSNRGGRPPVEQATLVAARPPVDTVFKFVFVAPKASKVSLVGDFNDWDATKAPMAQADKNGLWSVTLPLSVGRHVYAYVVDGDWLPDPQAPMTGDGFGHMNSVKVVTKGPTL